MQSIITNKLKAMIADAEEQMAQESVSLSEQKLLLGRANACQVLLQGMTPERLITTAKSKFWRGTIQSRAMLEVAENFKGLI